MDQRLDLVTILKIKVHVLLWRVSIWETPHY